jgi:xanthine dehydrogenase accessory factor
MNSEDLEVLQRCTQWMQEEHRILLVTVVQTWGSSPRPEGAMLAVRDDGRVVGSVSGGCIEDDLIDRVRRFGIDQKSPEIVKYGVSAEEAHRFGLPCGGTIQLVLEPLIPESRLDELHRAILNRRLVSRKVDLRTGVAMICDAAAITGVTITGETLITVHGPRYRMLIIGAGQLCRYMCEIASGLDYQITVCDPREEYISEWSFEGAAVTREMPHDVVRGMGLDERSAVVALTHDLELDDLALIEALRTRAFYVGALESHRDSASRRSRLLQFGLTEYEIARLRGPAGIFIGNRTPAEIALSILAEVTSAKNGISLPVSNKVEMAKNSGAASSCEPVGSKWEIRPA